MARFTDNYVNPTMANDYMYKNCERLAANWFRESPYFREHPTIDDLIYSMDMRGAFIAGLLLGSCLQQDIESKREPRV